MDVAEEQKGEPPHQRRRSLKYALSILREKNRAYSRFFSVSLLNRWTTLPPKVTSSLVP